MSTAQDWGIVFGKESTYGTGVTPTRALPCRSAALNIRRTRKSRDVFRVGSSKVKSVTDSVVTLTDAAGPVEFQPSSRGFGLLYEVMLGVGESNLVSTGLYQQNFTLGAALPSITFQEQLPSLATTLDDFDLNPFTFAGAMVEGWELSFPNNDLANLKVDLDCKSVVTTTAAASLTYADADDDHPYHFGEFCLYRGTFTAPTDTTLASATTAWGRAKSLSVSVKNSLMGSGPYACTGKGKPMPGLREITGTIVVEYVSGGPEVDAIINDTVLSLVGTCGTSEDANEKLQIALPAIKLGDELPKSNKGDTIELSIPFEGLMPADGSEPLWLIQRTLDAAL